MFLKFASLLMIMNQSSFYRAEYDYFDLTHGNVDSTVHGKFNPQMETMAETASHGNYDFDPRVQNLEQNIMEVKK